MAAERLRENLALAGASLARSPGALRASSEAVNWTADWSDAYQVLSQGVSSACQLMTSPGLTGSPV